MILKDNFTTLLEKSNSSGINNKYTEYINNLSNNINDIPNLILYGPNGSGKYSEALKIIEKYSPSLLKYEKKMIINSLKTEHILKISDIHYEIDLENLTCNSKILFNDIYNNIIDVIQSSKDKKGIILCKNFHEINNEIIEIFYSYMQKNMINNLTLKFIILTEHLSFIPTNIHDICKILYYSKLSHSNYIKLSNTNNKKFLLEKQKKYTSDNKTNFQYISNISSINFLKYIDLNESNENIINCKTSICNKIVNIIFSNEVNYNLIRNILYDILIYNLNIYDCIYYIVNSVILKKVELIGKELDEDFIVKIFSRICILFKYYNNNYRPIYHLEAFILYLIKIVNENEYTNSTV
tara:strand:- start:7068 stop:8126 length:1059 start_codon:yes stop_codon:yes gene_type:complete